VECNQLPVAPVTTSSTLTYQKSHPQSKYGTGQKVLWGWTGAGRGWVFSFSALGKGVGHPVL